MSELETYEQPNRSIVPARQGLSLGEKLQFANALAASELVPKAYRKKPENVLIAIEYGEMLNVHPLTSMSLIHVIDGKPTAAGEMMRAKVTEAGHKFRILNHSSTECTVQIVRADDPEYPTQVTFSMDDAARAGLLDLWWEMWRDGGQGQKGFMDKWFAPEGFPLQPTVDQMRGAGAPDWVIKQGPGRMKKKDNWFNYPAAMLLARATSAAVRAVCPEVLMGVSYTPEELGASVDEQGNVLDVAEVPAAPPSPEMVELLARFEALPDFVQAGMMERLTKDAHVAPSTPLVKFDHESWFKPIGDLLDYGERKAAEHAAEGSAPAASTGAAGAGDREVPEGVASASGTPAAPAPPAEPVEVLDVREAPAGPADPIDVMAAEVEAQTAARAPSRGGDSAPRDPAPGGAEPSSSGGDGASAGPTPPRPPTKTKTPIKAATRAQLFALLPKGIACPPEIGTAQSARDEYRRVMLLEGICPALGAGVLESRKDIDEDLGQQIIGVLKDMEAGRVELTDGPDGELAIVATAGSAA